MTTSRRVPRWALIGGAALLALVLGLLAVPFLVPVDHFRPLIVRLAEENTGRKIEIDALQLTAYIASRLDVRVMSLTHS